MTLNYKKEEFHSKLHDEHISGDGYERANLVWNRVNLRYGRIS